MINDQWCRTVKIFATDLWAPRYCKMREFPSTNFAKFYFQNCQILFLNYLNKQDQFKWIQYICWTITFNMLNLFEIWSMLTLQSETDKHRQMLGNWSIRQPICTINKIFKYMVQHVKDSLWLRWGQLKSRVTAYVDDKYITPLIWYFWT